MSRGGRTSKAMKTFFFPFSYLQELGHQAKLIHGMAKKVFSEMGSFVDYKVGTMIEVPRAAFVADEVIS